MKDQKRFAALALSAVMVFSMAGSVSAAQKVESKDDLAGATIGVQLGTTGDLDASDYEKDGSTVERYSKGSEAVQALKAGQIDCVIIDSQPAQKFVENADNLSTANKKRLKDTTESGKPCARCGFADFICTEGCKWGKNGALTRTI